MSSIVSLSVAVPWSLSHYIPLNGFHPLYRALFDHAPKNVMLSAWDNVSLYHRYRSDDCIRDSHVKMAKRINDSNKRLPTSSVAGRYQSYFWPPNQVLTAELCGDIEFHHTAPFPSMQRPFVFHCEMFAPLLFPFAHQGTGLFDRYDELREYYRHILAHPLCLGIWSHIPETSQTIAKFFRDPAIDKKLFQSRIGLSADSLPEGTLSKKPSLAKPRFLFMNSAHQNPANFFRRGGHIVLRFWKEFQAERRQGHLMFRCTRPSDEDLSEHGVDVSMVKAETGRSMFWVEDYLANHEMNALMESAHFFLLPSASLHSVSIMQAMQLGTIPIVTDTVGTSVYVTDHETGITLAGVRGATWQEDPTTGILVDLYCRNADLDDSLVRQLTERIGALLDEPSSYWEMRHRIQLSREKSLSGQAFSDEFWDGVTHLYEQYQDSNSKPVGVSAQSRCSLVGCTVSRDGWARIFESPTQPMVRINMDSSVVFEWGGAIVCAPGGSGLELNDWSVLTQHYDRNAPQVKFANTLEELEGSFLTFQTNTPSFDASKLARTFSQMLRPYPRLHKSAAQLWHRIRRPLLFYILKVSGRNQKRVSDVDTELVMHGVSGYNIIRQGRRYYGILQSEGEFTLEKVESEAYSSYFTGFSIEEVQAAIRSANRWKSVKMLAHPRAFLKMLKR